MKILLITTSYPVAQDGSEAAGSFVKDFSHALAKTNTVAVVFPSNNKGYIFSNTEVKHYPFQVSKLPLSLLLSCNPINWYTIFTTLSSGQKAINAAVLDFNPDHILALWTLPSGFWAYKSNRINNIPYSTWALGSDIWTLGKIPIIKSFLRRILRQAHSRFADGYLLRNDVSLIADKKAEFLPSSRILPVSKNKKIKVSPPYNLAFLGRWHRNKGIDILLNVLNLFEEEDWKKINEFKIAGGGPLESLVTKQIETLQQAGRPVRLSGFLNTHEAAELLSWADYLVIPSRIESIPVIFSDALQAHTPMAVTPVGDFPNLFDKTPPGVVAENITEYGLRQAIRKLLQTSPLDYLDNISEILHVFNMDKVVNSLISTITENK